MTPAAITAWHHVAQNHDIAALKRLLADDVVFESPVVHTPQMGKPITTAYLAAAMQVLGNAELPLPQRMARRNLVGAGVREHL